MVNNAAKRLCAMFNSSHDCSRVSKAELINPLQILGRKHSGRSELRLSSLPLEPAITEQLHEIVQLELGVNVMNVLSLF